MVSRKYRKYRNPLNISDGEGGDVHCVSSASDTSVADEGIIKVLLVLYVSSSDIYRPIIVIATGCTLKYTLCD